MDVLEEREAALRRQLFGTSSSSSSNNNNTGFSTRTADLSARLDQLYSAVTGFSRLNDLYVNSRKELEMAPTSALGAAAPRIGDDIKRAVILSSEPRVDEIACEFRKLQELHGALAQLEQLRNRNPVSEQQLQALERSTELQSQRALALHARVERVLAVLSEKCVEYTLLLDELS
ncbi:hypothetical protein PybrP1_000354 [[Pythium] brassicae (nom. inval.)]|nr:hypothetical protein PybrP1_000354 [[Pythium] brassicae (nom. inval.)]